MTGSIVSFERWQQEVEQVKQELQCQREEGTFDEEKITLCFNSYQKLQKEGSFIPGQEESIRREMGCLRGEMQLCFSQKRAILEEKLRQQQLQLSSIEQRAQMLHPQKHHVTQAVQQPTAPIFSKFSLIEDLKRSQHNLNEYLFPLAFLHLFFQNGDVELLAHDIGLDNTIIQELLMSIHKQISVPSAHALASYFCTFDSHLDYNALFSWFHGLSLSDEQKQLMTQLRLHPENFPTLSSFFDPFLAHDQIAYLARAIEIPEIALGGLVRKSVQTLSEPSRKKIAWFFRLLDPQFSPGFLSKWLEHPVYIEFHPYSPQSTGEPRSKQVRRGPTPNQKEKPVKSRKRQGGSPYPIMCSAERERLVVQLQDPSQWTPAQFLNQFLGSVSIKNFARSIDKDMDERELTRVLHGHTPSEAVAQQLACYFRGWDPKLDHQTLVRWFLQAK